MKKALKLGGLALLALIIAGIAAPYVKVDQYKEQIRAGIERALHRRVEINKGARLNLFRGPGFSVEGVVIYDDPAITIEPLANVPELQTTVSLASLWTGRLEFGTVRLIEPSLNVTKAEKGTWNLVSLLQSAASQAGSQFPEIQVSDGRINFKLNDVKSTFYLTDTDLTVTPRRDGFELRFSCAPARTDRAAGGYGSFTGRGAFAHGQIQMDVELEKSPIEELLTFARGQSLGLHGIIAARARVSGPVASPAIEGRFDMSDVHRWDLLASRAGAWSMKYRGGFDLAAQRFELIADEKNNPNAAVALRLLISNLLTRPDWRAEVAVGEMPASSLVEIARHMGTPLPSGLQVDGLTSGTIAYESSQGIQGDIHIANATVEVEDGPKFTLPEASLSLAGDAVHLLPAQLAGKGNSVEVEATYAPFRQHLEARVTGRNLRIADLQAGISGRALTGIEVPLMSRFKGGTWSGTLRYENEWTANVQVRDTVTSVPGLAEPVKLAAADVEIAGDRIAVRKMLATVGTIEAYGAYQYVPEEDRPHRFTLSIPSADVAEVERVFSPTLQRSGSLLARTLRWRDAEPEWLGDRRARGDVRIGVLSGGGSELHGVRARVLWDGPVVQIADIRGRFEDAPVSASLTANLSRREPQYKLSFAVRNWNSRYGHVDLTGDASMAGAGIDALGNLRAEGRFQARAVSVLPDVAFSGASGDFELTFRRAGPQIRITDVQAHAGPERFTGEGATQSDGKLLVDLSSQLRTLRLSGPVASLKSEVTAIR